MDLTSSKLALQSLKRRGVDANILTCADSVLKALDQKSPNDGMENLLKTLLESDSWESKAAGMLACSEWMRLGFGDDHLREIVSDYAEVNLEDREPRLRTCVVKVLEQLAIADGPGTWERFGPKLCEIVDKSFTLDESERAVTHRELALQEVHRKETEHIMTSLIHETIGWKALETSMRSVESLVRGYGANFVADGHLDWKDNYLIKLVSERALMHENRYVREVGYDLCGEIAAALCNATKGKRNNQTDALAKAVKRGLSDNWSQVRFAASVATRKLMIGLDDEEKKEYCPDLVPRMCLNRYYLAEGVRIYSQETWKLVFKDKGPEIVKEFIAYVVEYYCEQSRADNHGVREAACHCIAELSSKIDRGCLSPHVESLILALVDCFRDDSWPVRDAACIATGRFVHNFPAESRPYLEELFTLWFDHLSDNIWSVREDSAEAIGNILTAYPDVALERVLAELPDMLDKVHQHDPHAHQHHAHPYANNEDVIIPPKAPSSPRTMAGATSQPRGIVHGSLKTLRESSVDDRHSNQQMYSCGSLAPKLKRRGVGCMDHGYSRPKRNWEITDGGIYLLRELAKVKPDSAEQFMDPLAKILQANDLPIDLQVTLWKQLVHIAQALGKRPFKRYLEQFLPRMIATLTSESQLASAAAADCIMFLAKYLGKGILQGRVENLLNGERLWRMVDESPLIHFQQ